MPPKNKEFDTSAEPTREVGIESVDSISRPRNSGDLKVALQITEEILGRHREQGGAIDTKAIYGEVVAILEGLTEERTAAAIADSEDKYRYLIGGGRRALETELGYIENDPSIQNLQKEEQKKKIVDEYAEAKIMEKMAVVQVTEFLLNKFLNPYSSPEMLASLTDSSQNEVGQWSSEFNPDVAGAGLSKLISKKSLEEIRAGVQLALQMRGQVSKILTEHRGYDGRPDAKAIIEGVLGKKIAGRARVVSEGPLSISIVIDNEDDYYAVHGGDPKIRSGGFHNNYLYHWTGKRRFGDQFTTLDSRSDGLLNIINGYPDESTIDHENEHSLYEVLMHNRGKKQNPLAELPGKLKGVPEKKHERMLDGAVEEILFEAKNRFIANFANEAMAYVLNNESSDTPTNTIIETNFRRLTESKLYSHHHLTDSVIEEIKKDMLANLSAFGDGANRDELTSALAKEFEKKVEELATKKQLEENYRSILRALADLVKKFPNRKNFIRALLAGENPLKWPRIAQVIFSKEWDKITSGERNIKIKEHEGEKNTYQATAAWILITMLESEDTVDGSFSGAEETVEISGMKVVFREGNEWRQKSGPKFSSGFDRPVFIVQRLDNSDKRLIDGATGKVIFGHQGGIESISKPIQVDGKFACRVLASSPIKGGESKSMILKEDIDRPIGLEYSHVSDPINYQGKIIFRAMQENGLWRVVDENGNYLSEEFENIHNLQVFDDHLYLFIKRDGRRFAITEENKVIGPVEGFEKFYYNPEIIKAATGEIYVGLFNLDGKYARELYTEDGKKIEVSSNNLPKSMILRGANGLIIWQQPHPFGVAKQKLIFAHSGKTIEAESIGTQDESDLSPIFQIEEDNQKYWIDDTGEKISQNIPESLDIQQIIPVVGGHIFICNVKTGVSNETYLNESGEEIFRGCELSFVSQGLSGLLFSHFISYEKDNNKTFLIDSQGKKLFEIMDYSLVVEHSNQGKKYFEIRRSQSRGSLYDLVDVLGRPILENYETMVAFTGGVAVVKMVDGTVVSKNLSS